MPQSQKMKTLGLLGGTSWHSTQEYYRIINQRTNDYFGNNTNPPLLLFNMNQALVHRYQNEDDWQAIADMFAGASERLVKAGAEAVMFCANTPHRVFSEVQQQTSVPILHIADATAREISKQGIDAVGFLGTKFSMSQTFISDRIAQQNIRVLVPEDDSEQEELHRIIQKELTFGNVDSNSKKYVLESIDKMVSSGAKGIVLGCTEFPLMITASDLEIPIFNTTEIHALAAFEFVLNCEI